MDDSYNGLIHHPLLSLMILTRDGLTELVPSLDEEDQQWAIGRVRELDEQIADLEAGPRE